MSRVTGFEKNAGFELIKEHTDECWYVIVIDNEEGEQLYEGSDTQKAWEAATSMDEVVVEVWLRSEIEGDDSSWREGWAYLSHLNDGPEVIVNCGNGDWVDRWCKRTNYGQGEGGPDYA